MIAPKITDLVNLLLGCGDWHKNRSRNFELGGCPSHSLGVIARAGTNDAILSLRRAELRDAIVSTPDLKRTDILSIFSFEVNLAAITFGKIAVKLQGRVPNHSFKGLLSR